MAARIRRELGIDVDAVHGRYGEYTVLVDGETVMDGGPLVVIGVMPSSAKIIDRVRQALSA